MNEFHQSIRRALESESRISRKRVRHWIQRADSAEADALLYKLTGEAWNRIEPPLEPAETCALIQRYLLRCVRENPEGGFALNRYDAAGQLESWFDHLADMEDSHEILHGVAAAVTDLFLRSDESVRQAIETGFLEHVLEQRRLRPFFSDWAHDERLGDAWRRALAWGEAHPDLMKGLRERLREAQSEDE